MHVVAIGMSHKTAPIEVRERLALPQEERAAALQALARLAVVEEGVILATCNRLEIYATVHRYHDAMEELVRLLSHQSQMSVEDLMPRLYFLHHHEVARHLFRVAAGLDSMIIGESEILGQVKDAYQDALAGDTLGKILHDLFQRGLRLGKRARTETAIGENAASVSYAAVQQARAQLPSLEGRSILLVGAGKMAELAADNLCRQGAGPVLFANRTQQRARELAGRWGGHVVGMEELSKHLCGVDIAILSTASPEHVLTVDMLREVAATRGQRPLLLVDISVPRNVDPAAGQLTGIHLYDIDDLQSAVAASLKNREAEIPKVESLIQQEVAAFSRWLEQLEVAPLIRSLRRKAEQVRQEELDKLLQMLPGLTGKEQKAIEAATQVIVNKILNEPTVRLKEYATGEQADLYVQAVSDLFDLSGIDTRESAGGSVIDTEKVK